MDFIDTRALILGALALMLCDSTANAQGRRAGSGQRGAEPGPLAAYSATEPSWSRDGKLIAFTSDRAGGEDLYVMNADGSNIRRITSTPEPEHYPVWSPDGKQIAFFGAPDGKGGIYVMNADGSSRRLVALTDGDNPNRAAWSPDGKRLAFVARQGSDWSSDQIMLIKLDGTGLEKLPGAGPRDAMPAWSPDGSQIAFVSIRGGNADILVTALSGVGVRRVSADTVDEMFPTWSPDGKRIAFMADVGNHVHDLRIATLGSRDPAARVSRPGDWKAYPEWSTSDPNQMLEVSLRDGVVGIYLVDLKSGSAKWLTGPR